MNNDNNEVKIINNHFRMRHHSPKEPNYNLTNSFNVENYWLRRMANVITDMLDLVDNKLLPP